MKLEKIITLKKILKTKFTFERSLLLIILLLVIIPYAPKGYQALLDWRKDQLQIQEKEQTIRDEQARKEKLDILLKKYKIYSLSYNYRIPEEVYNYFKTKKEIDNNKNHYVCENPPRIEDIKSKSNYFSGVNKTLQEFEIDFFIDDCQRLEKLKPTYEKFSNELPKMENLLKENKNSPDKTILGFVNSLGQEINQYLNQLPVINIASVEFSNAREKFTKTPNQNFGHDAKYESEIDVDNDGKLEKVLITWQAMNHGPHKIQIIKENEIIFTVSDVQIEFIPSSGRNGFYIKSGLYGEEGLCCRIGDKFIRFYFDQDKFKPIWQQDSKFIQTKNN